jgi:predicted permease
MSALAKPLLYLALLSFLVAVVLSFTGPVMTIPAEAFSRACSNMALIAIGIALVDNGAGR